MSDLRAFLDRVRASRPADVVDVEHEVDPRHETAGIVTKLEMHGRSPILVFHRVKRSSIPLVTNVCGSMGRLALALGCSLRDVTRVYGERAERLIGPTVVTSAPCQEVVRRGDDVDLSFLPKLVYHEGDADAPYLTAAIVVARDPETGKTNLSYHRLMIAGRNRTGIFMEKGRHLDQIHAKYRARGRSMPVAAFVGAHPLWSLGAVYAGSADVEEYDVIGGLLERPLEVVPCVSDNGLSVPAGTELVLEGHVSPEASLREGPFGEFTGYGTGVIDTPVFTIDVLTHRKDMMLQDIVSGRMEHLVLSMPALEHRLLRDAKSIAPGVQRVALVAPLTAVVTLDKRDDDEPRRLMEALLRKDIYTKHVIVVDAEVDPSDLREVVAAIALHTQADAKVHVLRDQPGTPLDPSCDDPEGRSTKMGIDATRPVRPRRPVTRNRIPAEVFDRIDLEAYRPKTSKKA